jgi:hypothetical protein
MANVTEIFHAYISSVRQNAGIPNTEWSINHATHIKIFTDGCNSIQFVWINKYTMSKVTSCCNLLAPVRKLSLSSRRTRMSLSQMQRVFIVEHYLDLFLTKLARMSLVIHFQIFLCHTNRQYLVWWTVSVTQESRRTETVPVDHRC